MRISILAPYVFPKAYRVIGKSDKDKYNRFWKQCDGQWKDGFGHTAPEITQEGKYTESSRRPSKKEWFVVEMPKNWSDERIPKNGKDELTIDHARLLYLKGYNSYDAVASLPDGGLVLCGGPGERALSKDSVLEDGHTHMNSCFARGPAWRVTAKASR
jgi:hypothetical protein